MNNRINIFIFFITLFISLSFSQDLITNPKNPLGIAGKKPGRSLHLKEVIKITDEYGDYIFKSLKNIKIAPNESIFVSGPSSLFQFDKSGKYMGNFFKKGEGPGEIKYFGGYYLGKDTIVVVGAMPLKVINFLYNGKLKNEHTIHTAKSFTMLLGGWKDNLYFNQVGFDIRKIKTGINVRSNKLYCLNKGKGKLIEIGLSFTTSDALIKKTFKKGVSIMINSISDYLTCFDNSSMYVSNTERYLINRIDLSIRKVKEKFTRTFPPVKFLKKKKAGKVEEKITSVYKREKYNDIYKILCYKKNLFVFTSLMNGKKEILVDVFNSSGKYIDKFYIKIPGVERPDDLIRKSIVFHKGFMWTTDVDEDDTPFLIKYKLNID